MIHNLTNSYIEQALSLFVFVQQLLHHCIIYDIEQISQQLLLEYYNVVE